MPKLNHVVVTALKDQVSVVTARKKLSYRQIEGLPNGGMPEGQDPVYDQTHGLTLQKDQSIEIDLSDEQLTELQKHVDAGEVEVVIHKPPVQMQTETMAPSKAEPRKMEPAKKDEPKKGEAQK